ncbi:ANTAR domain-containing protein [Streptomyces sp. NPDC007971]|uniref:ANTAR domain-containing protein n=1 Tax=Streptomyces sp. NPDC007971 TaxID=3364799 RepID=UPI0036E9E9DA
MRAARWHRIHQAAGCVAAREDCSTAEALAWLQAVSARDGLSLLEVADGLLQPSTESELGLPRQDDRATETVCRA